MSPKKYPFHSLEDFLLSTTLTVDGHIDDGCDLYYPVRGVEIEATVLFADIASYTSRTLSLSPTETLIFVNMFLTWISAEALESGCGIVDKYIGDEMMIVFSKEFGSKDPFEEALKTARWIGENDVHGFMPHIGIASGNVTVGYVGTPLKYNCSVIGAPVALAAHCGSLKPTLTADQQAYSYIGFPAEEWGEREFEAVFPPVENNPIACANGDCPHTWTMLETRQVTLKNIGAVEISEIIKTSENTPQLTAENRAKLTLEELKRNNRYWPRGAGS